MSRYPQLAKPPQRSLELAFDALPRRSIVAVGPPHNAQVFIRLVVLHERNARAIAMWQPWVADLDRRALVVVRHACDYCFRLLLDAQLAARHQLPALPGRPHIPQLRL